MLQGQKLIGPSNDNDTALYRACLEFLKSKFKSSAGSSFPSFWAFSLRRDKMSDKMESEKRTHAMTDACMIHYAAQFIL